MLRLKEDPCQSEKQWSVRGRTSGKENLPARKQENSYAKKCITSAKASTEQPRLNRPSPLDSRKLAAQEFKLQPPRRGRASARTTKKAEQDYRKGQRHSRSTTSRKRSRATSNALKRKGRSAASHASLPRQARTAARNRGSVSRRSAARKASRTRRHAKAA